mgnify:CR=1 FL=1
MKADLVNLEEGSLNESSFKQKCIDSLDRLCIISLVVEL